MRSQDRGPVSQQVWHDKDPTLLQGHSPVMVKSPRNIHLRDVKHKQANKQIHPESVPSRWPSVPGQPIRRRQRRAAPGSWLFLGYRWKLVLPVFLSEWDPSNGDPNHYHYKDSVKTGETSIKTYRIHKYKNIEYFCLIACSLLSFRKEVVLVWNTFQLSWVLEH